MLKKLLIALLCMQLLFTGCTSRGGEEKSEDKEPQTSAVEEEPKAPAEEEAPVKQEEQKDPVKQEEPVKEEPKTPPAEKPSETTPPPVQEPAASASTPEPSAETAVFDVSCLDTFKASSTLKIDGFDCFASYENGTSFDPFIDDLKDILKDHPVISLSKEQQKRYEKKDTSEKWTVVEMHVISDRFNPCLYVFDDFVELVYNGNSTFISTDQETMEQIAALVQRTPGDRDPNTNQNLDPEKPDVVMG